MGAAGRVERPPAIRAKIPLARVLVGWFLLLTLVPLVLVTLAASFNAGNLLKREATNRLVAIAERQSRQLEIYLEERQRAAASLGRSPSIGDALVLDPESESPRARSLHAFLSHFQEVSGWDEILLVTLDGRVVLAAADSPALGTSLKTGPFASTGLATLV
jgi:C4-dicarboxylate-specific signal transduction histidine kinase